MKKKMLEQAARRFPWSRDVAEEVLVAHNRAVSNIQELSRVMGTLSVDDAADDEGFAKRYRRRYIRNVGESLSELSDMSEAIYSKYPDLAPEALRKYYVVSPPS